MLTAEQIVAAQKANLETLFGLTQKAFEGVEKLVELNIQATKAAMAEAANNTQAMMSVKDAQELLSLQASLMQPLAEKTVAYSRHLYDIASGTGAEFGKAAFALGVRYLGVCCGAGPHHISQSMPAGGSVSGRFSPGRPWHPAWCRRGLRLHAPRPQQPRHSGEG